MKKVLLSLLVISLLFLITLFSSMPSVLAACEAGNISSCTIISSSGYWCLNQSITDGTDGCVSILVSDVNFDGQNFLIDGNNAGVGVQTSGTNITIINTNFSDWETASISIGGENNTIKNIKISGGARGIDIIDYNYTTLFNCNISNVTTSGIYITSSSYNNISYNNISAGGAGGGAGVTPLYGLSFTSSHNNTITGNRLSSINFSMTFENSVNNTARSNVINNSVSAGFKLTNSNSTTLIGNTLTNCASGGFDLTYSYFNNLTENTIDNVTNSGFLLTTSSNNSITLNNITDMESIGINLSSSNYNNLTNNTFTNPDLTQTSATGIQFSSSSNNKINDNEMTNLSSGGIKLTSSNYNEIRNNSYYIPTTANSNKVIWLISSTDNNISQGTFGGGVVTVSIDAPLIALETSSDDNRIENVNIPVSWRAIFANNSNNNLFSGLIVWAQGNLIELYNASNNTFEDSNFSRYSYGSSPYFYKSDNNSLNNTGTNVLFNSTSSGANYLNETYINFSGDSFNIRESNISYTPRGHIGKVLIFQKTETIEDYNVSLNITYTDADLSNKYIYNESTMRIQSRDGGGSWNNLINTDVVEGSNYVWGIIEESFTEERALAPIGDPDYPPQVNLVSPEDEYLSIETSVNFIFNFTDDLNTTLNCSLYIDSILNATNSSTINNTNTNFTVNGLAIGDHNWTINCSDAYNSNISETRDFTIGSSPAGCGNLDSVGRTYLLNQTFRSNDTCFTITANSVTLDCRGYTINYSEDGGNDEYGVTNNPGVTGIIIKNCNINEGSSANNDKSGIYLNTPGTFTIFNSTIITRSSGAVSGSNGIYINGGTDTGNATNNTISILGNTGHGIYVPATGSTDNLVLSKNTITTSGTTSHGIFIEAGNSENITNNTLNTGAGNYGIYLGGSSCRLEYNNLTNSIIGIYLSAGNIGTRNEFNETFISWSNSVGVLKISNADEFPANPTSYVNITKYINITSSASTDWINFTLYYEDSDLGSANESLLAIWRYNGSVWSNFTSVIDETNNFVYANVTNFSTFAILGVMESISPVASFGTAPVNYYNSSNSSITFELKCSDNNALSYLQLWTNSTGTWHANQTNTTPINNSYWNITVSNIPQGYHAWAAYCNDTSGNSDWTGTNRTFYVDTTNPIASFGTNPVNNYNSTSSSIDFDLKCSDNFNVSWLQLWTNKSGTWQADYSNSSYTNNTWVNTTITGIAAGRNYLWAVYCNDTSGNSNWTGTNRTFNVSLSEILPPENFSIYLLNSTIETMKLNWSEVSGASGYYLWYSDNATWILQLNETNSTPANVSLAGSTNTSWNDTTANSSRKRFYALASYSGSVKNVSDDRLGKHTLTILNESTNHTMLSLPLNMTLNITGITPPNSLSWIITVNESANNDVIYSYSSGTNWQGTLTELEFGTGYYFDGFETETNFTAYGTIPTGNITQFILNESTNHTMLGWQSYTNGNISALITPPNNLCWIITVNESANNDVISAYSSGGIWVGDLTTLEPGKGYYFDGFENETNLSYERNAH